MGPTDRPKNHRQCKQRKSMNKADLRVLATARLGLRRTNGPKDTERQHPRANELCQTFRKERQFFIHRSITSAPLPTFSTTRGYTRVPLCPCPTERRASIDTNSFNTRLAKCSCGDPQTVFSFTFRVLSDNEWTVVGFCCGAGRYLLYLSV